MGGIRRGTAPLLGTLVLLLEEDAVPNSDKIFIARAYEALLARHASEEEISRADKGLSSGFLSRAEIVQELMASAEFQGLFGRRPRRPEIELASLTRIEAFLIDRIRAVFQPGHLRPPAHMRWRVGEGPWDIYGPATSRCTGRHFPKPSCCAMLT